MQQGSVLSSMLLLLINGPSSTAASKSSEHFYTVGFLHADDIRTLASSISTANCNFLKLNIGMSEVIVFSNERSATSVECS